MVRADMTTDLQGELEKKLSDIGFKEQALASQQLAKQLGIPFADLKGLPVDSEALKQLDEATARGAHIVLIQSKGHTAVAATTDPRPPATQKVIDQLKAKFPSLTVILVSPATLESVFARYATIKTRETFAVGSITVDDAVLKETATHVRNVDDLKAQIAGANVTQLFEVLVAGALATKASDIHIEPEANVVRLRYRLDGLLMDVLTLDRERYAKILSRMKVLTKVKLNIIKAPQDGRFTIQESGVDIEVRVSFLPSEYGESIVMRLLDPRNIHAKLEDLGMRADVLAQVRALLARPQGALLTTGPTGSGKTTTLYAFLNELNTPDVKIITVEDPIEYHIQGVNQTQVEPDKGYTFGSGLRAIVRQDPDIILIGEIRDLETAGIALEAALTGHMVLSTIHTNDAAGTVPRLVDIGIKPETIAPAVTMAMGQRLLRRLCLKCRKPQPLAGDELKRTIEQLTPIRERFKLPELNDKLSTYGPVGCSECNNTGYQGRVGVYEVFEVTRDMERLILSSPSVSDVRDQAIKDGMVTMLQDGYLKLVEGTTSVDEIHRVLG